MKRIDLHVHTTASDGTLSPSEVVELAHRSSLSAIAITDHDTVSGIKEALAAGEKYGVEIIPGIELSTRYKGAVHILGYNLDINSEALLKMTDFIVHDRDTRNRKIISQMQKHGINITYEYMKDRFGEIVGRPHFAEIFVENNMAADTADAFRRLLSKGNEFWFPRTTISIEECISLILTAGGIPVLAHPFEYSYEEKSLPELIEYCMSVGLLGIECRHSSHTPGQMAYLENIANEYGLIKTGGSDFHGAIKPGINLGCGKGLLSIPYSWLESIKGRDLH